MKHLYVYCLFLKSHCSCYSSLQSLIVRILLELPFYLFHFYRGLSLGLTGITLHTELRWILGSVKNKIKLLVLAIITSRKRKRNLL